MLLTQTAEYALRAMATLASLAPGEALRAVDLAERTGIPVHYLSKIMRRLVLQRLVTSRKGHGGGFSLGRPPAKITFEEILSVDPYFETTTQCAFGWGNCNKNNPCLLHSTWSGMKESFQKWARTTTLATVRDDQNGGTGTRTRSRKKG
jgi:Rrf2 family transcriptional regulator, iron-sulfur cluster assembly transcription factor